MKKDEPPYVDCPPLFYCEESKKSIYKKSWVIWNDG